MHRLFSSQPVWLVVAGTVLSLLVSPSECRATNPSGDGSASPATVVAGEPSLLTVTVMPGANPTSSGLNVIANLTAIGGSSAQTIFDDGTNGDAAAGDLTFSYSAIASYGGDGSTSIPVQITDAQGRQGSTWISLTVMFSDPTGAGSASPAMMVAGGSTLLTAIVTPGRNPTSSGLTVAVNLTTIGGSPAQAMFDDGTFGDAAAGDLQFSYLATVPAGTSSGSRTLPFWISDAETREASGSIHLDVATNPSGDGSASPATVVAGEPSLLTVTVMPGANPTSSGLNVIANLTAIGGSSAQTIFDDGTNGDAAAGDLTFSYNAAVPAATSAGSKTLPFQIFDAEGRQGTGFIPLVVGSLTAVPQQEFQFSLVSTGRNPTSAPLRITFTLPSDAPARLKLIAITGRVVLTRDVGALGRGVHHLRIDDRIATGIYFVKLSQGSRSVTRRVTFIR